MGRVLLIDDATLARDLLKLILTEGGYEIAGEADNGITGVEEYIRLKPDLVIMDMIMPGLSGMETLRSIMAKDPGASILVVSADGQEGHVEQAVREGASGYVIKPYRKAVVLSEVEKIIGKPRV
jgi:two-component system chemotaxis response regulator CheY